MRQAWIVAALTFRYLVTTRRGIAAVVLAASPLLLILSLALARVATFDILLFQVLMIPLFLQVVLIFVTLVHATTLIREEIEDNTLPYLLTRPISKPAIVAYKYLGYVAAVLVLMVPPVVLAYAVTAWYTGTPLQTDLDVLSGFVSATVLGSVAYGALFLFISVVIRKPLTVGLLVGFVWESIVGSIPGDVPKLSVIHYLRSVLKDTIDVGPLVGYPTDLSAGVAALVLVLFSITTVVASMVLLERMEFRHKA